jgi:hypothetical protein
MGDPRSQVWLKVVSPWAIGLMLLVGVAAGLLVLYRGLHPPVADAPNQPIRPLDGVTAELSRLRRESDERFEQLGLRVSALEKAASAGCAKAYLVVRSPVAKDRLSINGRYVGSTGAHEHEVCAGRVSVQIEADGHIKSSQDLMLQPGVRRTLRVSLPPKASTPNPVR